VPHFWEWRLRRELRQRFAVVSVAVACWGKLIASRPGFAFAIPGSFDRRRIRLSSHGLGLHGSCSSFRPRLLSIKPILGWQRNATLLFFDLAFALAPHFNLSHQAGNTGSCLAHQLGDSAALSQGCLGEPAVSIPAVTL